MATTDVSAPSLRLPRGVLVVALATFVVLALAAVLVGTETADNVIRTYLFTMASPGVLAAMRVVNVVGD